MNTLPYQRILTSINLLIENSKEMQDILEGIKSIDSPLYTSKEYCTIKVCTSRQTGHTTAIKTFVQNRILNEKETWAILSPKTMMSQRILTYFLPDDNDSILKRNIDKIEYKNGSSIFFYGIPTFFAKEIKLKGSELNGIIVDCASFVKSNDIEGIYKIGVASMKDKEYVNFIFVE